MLPLAWSPDNAHNGAWNFVSKDGGNYLEKGLEGADILFEECPECDLFYGEEVENEVFCVN
jgi:hypothetical protein